MDRRFTDEGLDALRERAAARGRSVRALPRHMVTAAVNECPRLFDEAAAPAAEGECGAGPAARPTHCLTMSAGAHGCTGIASRLPRRARRL